MSSYIENVLGDITSCSINKVLKSASMNYERSRCNININEEFVLETLHNVYGIMFVKYSDYVCLLNKLYEFYAKDLFGVKFNEQPKTFEPDTTEEEYMRFFNLRNN